ncbi:MAG: MBL fold metallo-hydrolase [Promethearchaeota archaeon]
MINYRFEPLNTTHTCKAYAIRPIESSSVIIVDPQLDHLEYYIDYIAKEDLVLKFVIDTHTHADHLSAGAALKEKYNAELIMGENSLAKCVTHPVKDNDQLLFEGIPIKFIETPGHTTDSISVILPNEILTGDALFLDEGGAGRDDLPGGDSADHWETLIKLKKLPEDLVVYPSHDYRGRIPSSLGNQKSTNPFLKIETKEKFIEFLEDLLLGPAEWMTGVLQANASCSQDPKAAWVPLDSPSCEVMGTLDPELEKFEVSGISTQQLEIELNLPATEGSILIDVRSKQELSGKLGVLKEATIQIALSSIMNDVSQLNQFKGKQIITICGSGKRAKIAARMIKKSGFKNPLYLEGGIKKWKNK